QKDEQAAVAINKHYVDVLKETVSTHKGEVLNDYGDGSLCIFSSVTEALRCAMEMQHKLQTEPKVPLRVGLHVGEIFFEHGKVFGDGVNVASRVQSLGVANSILFSSEVCSKIRNQQEFKSVSIGRFHFKNVDEPMEVFAIANDGFVIPDKKNIEGKLKENKNSAKRKWLISIGVLIFAAISFFLYNYFLTGNNIKSIAVLPFINGSADKQNEYLSDGIAQEIISQISKINSLEVKGWGSSIFFKNSDKSLKEKAEALGAQEIVTGSVEKDSDRVVIRVELTEANTGKRLWGEEYRRQWGDILNIQTEVAQKIASALNGKLTPKEKLDLSKHSTENVEAYKFYIKGKYFWNKLGQENIDSAEANYKKAIELEPEYALAYAGLADCYSINFKGISQLELVPIAKIYAQKALSIDSTLSEALTTLGFIQQNFDYAWADAKTNLERAINLDPSNYEAHINYGLALMYSTSDKQGALRELKKAVDLNPLSYLTNWQLSRNYYFAGEYDLAIEQFKKTEIFAAKPQKSIPLWSTGLIYLKQSLFPQAKEIFDNLPQGNALQLDNNQVMQAYGYAVLGDKTKAKSLLEETMKKYPNLANSNYRYSQVYVALGDFNEALNQLELGYGNRDVHMFWINVDPAFDPIRKEPRFIALLKKMNLD
ncbi:MAG TPA: tetratricopeptide repeat protein, partial [Ginsengibacter sp.]